MNHTLLHRINTIQAEFEAEMPLDLRHLAELPVSRDIGVEAALPSRFFNEPQPQDDTPAPNLRWFLVVVVLAFALAAIRAFH